MSEHEISEMQRAFLELGANMVPRLFETIAEGGRESEFLLGERMIDGRCARLTLRVVVVRGAGFRTSAVSHAP